MDLATFEREAAAHRQVYEALREKIRGDYAGKYVALAERRIVSVGSNYDQVREAVERLRPVPDYFLIFPAEMEPAFELALDL